MFKGILIFFHYCKPCTFRLALIDMCSHVHFWDNIELRLSPYINHTKPPAIYTCRNSSQTGAHSHCALMFDSRTMLYIQLPSVVQLHQACSCTYVWKTHHRHENIDCVLMISSRPLCSANNNLLLSFFQLLCHACSSAYDGTGYKFKFSHPGPSHVHICLSGERVDEAITHSPRANIVYNISSTYLHIMIKLVHT